MMRASPGGGIGRRTGLKIRCRASGVPVRVRLGAPLVNLLTACTKVVTVLINAFELLINRTMGICLHCGSPFPKTRRSRKYCTNRCKTNACLEKKPRLKAGQVEALHALLETEFASVDALRERLREIVAPHLPPIAAPDEPIRVPRLD